MDCEVHENSCEGGGFGGEGDRGWPLHFPSLQARPSFLPSAMGSCRPVAAELLLPPDFIHPSIHFSLSLSLYNPTLFIPTPPSPANKVDGWVLGNGYFFPLTHVS